MKPRFSTFFFRSPDSSIFYAIINFILARNISSNCFRASVLICAIVDFLEYFDAASLIYSFLFSTVSQIFSGRLGVANALLFGEPFNQICQYFLKLMLVCLFPLMGLDGLEIDGKSLSLSSGISIIYSLFSSDIFSMTSLSRTFDIVLLNKFAIKIILINLLIKMSFE